MPESGPTGYVAWHEWAKAQVKAGWRQARCEKCRLWKIWTKKSETPERVCKACRAHA